VAATGWKKRNGKGNVKGGRKETVKKKKKNRANQHGTGGMRTKSPPGVNKGETAPVSLGSAGQEEVLEGREKEPGTKGKTARRPKKRKSNGKKVLQGYKKVSGKRKRFLGPNVHPNNPNCDERGKGALQGFQTPRERQGGLQASGQPEKKQKIATGKSPV